MLKTAPNPIDVQDIQFKLRFRLKVFENTNSANFCKNCSLVACASRYGLIFIGTNTASIQVLQLKNLENLTKSNGDQSDYPRRNISLPSIPTHLSVNCEHTIVAIVIERSGCPWALFYDVKSFWSQNVVQIGEVRLSASPGTHILETNWNPTLAAVFTVCKSDGSLGIYEIKNPGIDINELPPVSGATCFCWSPKGKQIAVGSRDGKITQYKPDLKAVKVINAPPLKEPHTLLSLQWVSNYQFIGVFQSGSSTNQASLIVIDAPKGGETTYINYDDICYSNGNTRTAQFYMILQQNWNILLVTSSNSMEVGVLGNSGESWIQWILGDAARAELPLTSDHQETLPIGCDLDIGNTQPLQWGEAILPPTPFLLLLSHYGVLCCFNVINLKEGVPTVCTPPESVKDDSGSHEFVSRTSIASQINSAPQASPSLTPASNVLLKQIQQRIETPTAAIEKAEVKPSAQKTKELSFSSPQPLSLFGGQATLTPVTPTTKNSSFVIPSLHPTVSSLYPSLPTEETKNSASANFTSASTTATQQASSLNTFKLRQLDVSEEMKKTDLINVDLKAEEETEAIFAQMVQEECIFLESELKAILHQGKSLKLNLGSDADKTKIVENAKALQDFFKEMMDICTAQNAEVHILKQNVLQSLAWYEEVKSRYTASKNESMVILLKAQPLDSVSEKQLDDIRHANYYLESQIAQANRVLDEQWESFQDYCKKTHRIQIPTMEIIFQTMVKQNAILRKQSYILKDIGSRIKSKSRSALGPSLLVSFSRDLPDEIQRLRMTPEDVCQIQYEHVVNRMKNFTQKKSDVLRNFLKKREYCHISAVKPQLSTSIIQASPSTRFRQLSLLSSSKTGPPVTPPVATEFTPKKLDFAQSSPKPADVDVESGTPIQGLQNFTSKFEAKNFNKLSPLTKSVIAGSPNSAFVSTSFGSNPPISPSISSSFKPVSFGFSGVTAAGIKTTPTFVATTTTPIANQPIITISTNVSKPFAFTRNPEVNTSSVLKSPSVSFIGATAVGMTKPSFTFTLQTKPTPTTASVSVFSTATSKISNSTFDSGTKPNSTSSSTLNFTVSTKPLASVSDTNSVSLKPNTTVSSGFNVSLIKITSSATATAGSTSTSVNSALLPSTISSVSTTTAPVIFGQSNQKLSESSTVSSSTPFVFSSFASTKPVASPAITQNRFMFSSANNVFSTAQTVNLGTTVGSSSDTSNKVSSINVSATPAIVTSKSTVTTTATVPSQSIFASTLSPSKPSLFTPNTTSTLLFSTSEQSANSKSPTLSTTTVPVTAVTTSGTAVVTAVTVSTASVTPVVTTPVPTPVPAPVPAPSAVTTSAVSTTQNLFATQSTNSQNSLFKPTSQSPTLSAPTSTGFAFGSDSPAKPSVFSDKESNLAKASILGAPQSSATSSVFGTPTATTSQSLTFGSPATNQTSVFGTSGPSTTSIFGSAPPSATPVFGLPVTSAAPLFGTTKTSAAPIFGATATSSSVFATAVTSTSSVFGSAPTSTTSVFGGTVTSTTPQSSIFGNVSGATTTQSQGFGMFGGTAPKGSIFGAATPSTQPSVFGGNTQVSIFGATTTASSSTFGQAQSVFEPSKSTQSVFGTNSGFGSSAPFANSSVFGNSSPAFAQPTGSVFGNTATTTSSSIFGGTPTTSSAFGSNSIFGSPASSTQSPFGSTSVFSSTATQPSSFASNTSSGSFGFGTLNVGSTSTTSNSAFGAIPTSNPFATNKSVFGASPTTSASSIFGSNTTSPFGNPAPGFGNNSFGNQSVFGQQQQQSAFSQSAFGSSTFGQQSPGPFSGGTSGTVAQSGFGGNSTFQKPAGFGSSPVFGSTPFGNPPSFGGAPAFGAAASFGSPPKVFGSGSSGFGSASSTQNTGFGNLANQPTVGFGNLAQQASAGAAPNSPFAGSSSFSSWR